MYALIMAGGSGTRLWPKSRTNSPKQLHSLVLPGSSMFQDTIQRIKSLIPCHKIWVVTNANYVHKIKEQVPSIPAENILVEPYSLGTALAIGLGIARIYQLDKKARVVVLWSDNVIKKRRNFLSALRFAFKVVEKYDGVIIGVNPTYPATAYGYIEMGKELEQSRDLKAFKIRKFYEKPEIKKAKEFLVSWRYLWNSGISVWNAKKFLRLFAKLLPYHYQKIEAIKKYFTRPEFLTKIEKEFKSLEKIPIDYAIYEKAQNLTTIPSDLDWSDVGSWASLQDILAENSEDNIVRGKFLGLDTKKCLIYGGQRLISTIGLSDLIIIDTDDALLITHRKNAEKVKDLTNLLKEKGLEEYL